MKNSTRLLAMILALLMTVSILPGCIQTVDTPETTEGIQPTTEPTTEPTTDPTTEPTTEPVTEPGAVTSVHVTQLDAASGGWMDDFAAQYGGPLTVVGNTERLNTVNNSLGENAEIPDGLYDDSFFEANRLAVIPVTSESGSTTYSCTCEFDGELITLTLTEHTGDTTDMGYFLLLVVLPLEACPAGYQIDLLRN